MFDHSVVVPRNYKIAANIVQKVSEEGGSVKTLLYKDKLKHFRTDVLYALVSETIKHAIDIEKLFESTGILVNEPRLNPWLARVLTAELIYGKKSLVSQSKPVQTVLSYKEKFMKFKPEVQDDEKSKVVRRPRYVRINTNLLTTSDAIRAFQDEGYKFIRCTSGSYNDYLQQIQNLTEYDFTQDYHVKTIFVFSPRTKLHGHDLYMENKIILQDKATALAVHLLAPPPGSVVLDMCAAPGMKTTQLAAYMRNEGKVYAVERDDKRYVTLCEFVESTGSKCVETFHKDSLEIKRGDLDDVEYILLDPSCSGSGMDLSVHSYVEESRMAKLTSLQEKFLKHAMNSFSNAKRIVYSTCSIFAEENERVVTNVVKASRARWRVRDVKELLKGQWNNFGSGMYGSMGTRCLYAKSDSDLTTGFFLAVLDRDLRDTETQQDEDEVADVDKKLKDKTKKHRDKNNINVEKQQTKKKHSESESNDIEHVSNLEELSNGMNDGHKVSKTKKKKRNKVNKMLSQDEDSHNETTNNRDEIIEISEKIHDIADLKKKKRKSKSVKDAETIIDVNVKSGDQSSKEKHDNNDKSSHEQELSDEIKTDITNNKKKRKFFDHPETSETKTFKNNEEIEIPTKKKKKHKHHDTEIQKDLMEPDTFIDKENNLLEKNDESENPKKKKKKRETELQKDVFEPVIDMSTDKENTKTPEKSKLFENNDGISMPKKKKKKCKKLEDESKKSVTVPDINMSSQSEKNKCLEKSELLENNEEIEMSKKKKKKRKDHQNEPEALSESVIDISLEIENNNASENIDISLIENIDQTEKSKKIKKKRKERDNESLEAVIDIVSDGAQGKVSKKGKKKENVAQ